MVRKIFKALFIVQYRKEEVNNKVIKFRESRRLNPFNPLTYLVIVGAIISGLIMFGLVGFWEQVDLRNPFKWK